MLGNRLNPKTRTKLVKLGDRAKYTARRLGATVLNVPDDYGLVLGPELNTTGTAGWMTYSASQSIAGDTITVTSSGGFGGIYKNFPTEIGKRYLVVSASSNGTSNSATIKASGASLANTTTGLQTLRPSFAATVTSTPINLELGSTMGVGTFTAPSVREIISATSFIDSTGTQPVTAINDLVGLLTDRSYGAGNLGPELVTTPSWAGPSIGGAAFNVQAVTPAAVLVSGKTYRLTASVSGYSGSGTVGFSSAEFGGSTAAAISGNGIISAAVVASSTGPAYVYTRSTNTCTFSSISVREVLGNHATQPTTASKPLVTRVPRKLGPNLVVNGTGDSTAGWFLQDGVLSTSGGEFVITANGGLYTNAGQPVSVTAGRSYQVTTKIRRGTSNYASLQLENGGAYPEFGNAGTTTGVQTLVVVAATSTFSVRIWLAQQANGATAFFDDVEVREVLEWTPALDFDGSNDLLTLSSGAILQQGSDHFVTAAFVLDVVGATQTIYAASNTANGMPFVAWFYVDGATNKLSCSWRDNAGVNVLPISSAVLSAGVSYVATAAKVGNSYTLWLNGVVTATQTATLGATTLNTSNIGALVRTTTTGYLNGKLIDIVIDQGTLTEADRILIETNMARRARAQYAVSTPTLSLDFTTGSYSVSNGEI